MLPQKQVLCFVDIFSISVCLDCSLERCMHLLAFCLWLKFWEMIDEDGLSTKDMGLYLKKGKYQNQKWGRFRNVKHVHRPTLVTNLVSDLDQISRRSVLFRKSIRNSCHLINMHSPDNKVYICFLSVLQIMPMALLAIHWLYSILYFNLGTFYLFYIVN